MRLDLSLAFSDRSGIGQEDFLRTFYDSVPPPQIGDFNSQYLADDETLREILSEIAYRTGLEVSRVESHYHAEESFPQFGEHLLRAGAYS
jgi:hypothetical protein